MPERRHSAPDKFRQRTGGDGSIGSSRDDKIGIPSDNIARGKAYGIHAGGAGSGNGLDLSPAAQKHGKRAGGRMRRGLTYQERGARLVPMFGPLKA
jgi:hypothetical protein